MKIYIMRHGETDYNKRQTLQGHIDSHLNETGRSQARGAAEYIREKSLNFDRIYVSHLDRAQGTGAARFFLLMRFIALTKRSRTISCLLLKTAP